VHAPKQNLHFKINGHDHSSNFKKLFNLTSFALFLKPLSLSLSLSPLKLCFLFQRFSEKIHFTLRKKMSNILQNRRSSFSSSTKSSLAKRQAPSSSENSVKLMPAMTKKRAPLSNITNQKIASRLQNSDSVRFFNFAMNFSKSFVSVIYLV